MNIDDLWQYLILFGLAAAPWLEVFLVVPIGIAWGLNPIAVAITGFLGNWIPILLIATFYERIANWLRQRRARKKGLTPEEVSVVSEKKTKRAQKIMDRYGTPGLAIIAPGFIGTDTATLLALIFGSSKKWVIIWMTFGLAFWTILLTIGSYYGLAYMDLFKH